MNQVKFFTGKTGEPCEEFKTKASFEEIELVAARKGVDRRADCFHCEPELISRWKIGFKKGVTLNSTFYPIVTIVIVIIAVIIIIVLGKTLDA